MCLADLVFVHAVFLQQQRPLVVPGVEVCLCIHQGVLHVSGPAFCEGWHVVRATQKRNRVATGVTEIFFKADNLFKETTERREWAWKLGPANIRRSNQPRSQGPGGCVQIEEWAGFESNITNELWGLPWAGQKLKGTQPAPPTQRKIKDYSVQSKFPVRLVNGWISFSLNGQEFQWKDRNRTGHNQRRRMQDMLISMISISGAGFEGIKRTWVTPIAESLTGGTADVSVLLWRLIAHKTKHYNIRT